MTTVPGRRHETKVWRMPELPEVETIRRQLDKEVVGKRVKTVEVSGMRSIRRHSTKKQFTSRLEGHKLSKVERRGKYLILTLDEGDLLVIHLGMSGQLRRHANKDEVAKHTHVVMTFTQHGQLRYVDPRTFGELFITVPDELNEEVPELADLGRDPIEEPMNWMVFGEMLHARKMKLKAFLMDQSILAGIGNIYSDEILYDAGLRYDRLTNTLSSQEIRRLYRSVVGILHDAIKFGGSTLPDEGYVDLHGESGEYQDHHQAYNRYKLACRRCRAPISKTKFQSRTTYFCPSCQI
jgi:formamidopyrimidine-DNA glycosylase